MKRRAAHLTPENAANFKQKGVAERYHLRLPYPDALFPALTELLPDVSPRTVLDVGTGNGTIARPLAPYVDRVDAVDFSDAMIKAGKSAPGGDNPRIHWIRGRVEEVALGNAYGLIVGGDSLHWMDWDIVFPRFHELLVPEGIVAIAGRFPQVTPWDNELMALITHYSVYQNFEAYDLIHDLTENGLFIEIGRKLFEPFVHRMTIDDYIRSLHSMGSMATGVMPPESIAAFDQQLREAVLPHAENGVLTFHVVGSLVWGKPLKP